MTNGKGKSKDNVAQSFETKEKSDTLDAGLVL
jgi:hypothetical protein